MKIKSLEKTFKLIEIISDYPNGIRLKDLKNETNMKSSTIFHILNTLLSIHVLIKSNKKYYLGQKIMELSNKIYDDSIILNRILPHIENIFKNFNENIILMLMDKKNPSIIKYFSSSHIVRPQTYQLNLEQAHCSAWGKLLLSSFTTEELEEHFRKYGLKKFTVNTITDINSLHQKLKEIKIKGFAMDNEEWAEGLICLGIKIPKTYFQNIPLALIISIPKQRCNSKTIKEISNKLKEFRTIFQ